MSDHEQAAAKISGYLAEVSHTVGCWSEEEIAKLLAKHYDRQTLTVKQWQAVIFAMEYTKDNTAVSDAHTEALAAIRAAMEECDATS